MFGATIGPNVAIYPTSRIWAPWNLIVEQAATLGGGTNIYNVDRIQIGESAIISQGAHLCTASHDHNSEGFELVTAPIQIGDNVWIAAEAFVGPGVEIGSHAVVGARAVVTSNFSARSILAGNPAKVIGERDAEGQNALR